MLPIRRLETKKITPCLSLDAVDVRSLPLGIPDELFLKKNAEPETGSAQFKLISDQTEGLFFPFVYWITRPGS